MGWTMIEQVSLSSSQASVTLGSGGTIPQTYKTLKVVVSARSSTNDGSDTWSQTSMSINGVTTNRTRRSLLGTGSAAISDSGTDSNVIWISGATSTSSTFGSAEVTLPNYAGSTNKPISSDSVSENNGTNALQHLGAMLWSNTSAITSLTFTAGGAGNFVSGSTFTLYALK